MKFNYKVNLGNILGAVAKSVPELSEKVNVKDFSDISMEGSAEYTVAEASAIIGEVKQLIVDLPGIIGIAMIEARKFQAILDEIDEECDGDCDNCEEASIIARYSDGTEKEVTFQEALEIANEANDEMNKEIRELTAKNEELKEDNVELRRSIYTLKQELKSARKAQKIRS